MSIVPSEAPSWTPVGSNGFPFGGSRVLIVVHGYPPKQSGGAERRAERTARRLQGRGFTVAVLCVDGIEAGATRGQWRDEVQDQIPVRRVKLGLRPGTEGFRLSYDNPVIEDALIDLFAEWRPDVIHQFSGYLTSTRVVDVAVAHRLPIVVSLTDYWWLCHRVNLITSGNRRCEGPDTVNCARCHAESFRRFRLPAEICAPAAERFWGLARQLPSLGTLLGTGEQELRSATTLNALRRADAIVTPSRYLADFYASHGIEMSKLVVSRQGVDRPKVVTRKESVELRCGYVGQVKPHKGVDLLVEAWARLTGPRPRRLTIYGSDQGAEGYGQQIRTTIRGLPSAAWDGEFEHARLWEVLASLDVLVVPSRWVENSPNVILEAHAAGVPVVATDFGAMPELVRHDDNGLLFPVDDACELGAALQRLLDEPTLVGRLSKAAPTVRSIDDEINDLIAVYEGIMRDHSRL